MPKTSELATQNEIITHIYKFNHRVISTEKAIVNKVKQNTYKQKELDRERTFSYKTEE